jgi:hypothetical protein
MLAGATIGAVLAMGFGVRTLSLFRCPFPITGVLTSVVATGGMWAISLIRTQSIILDIELKCLPVIGLVILGLSGADIGRQFVKAILKYPRATISAHNTEP